MIPAQPLELRYYIALNGRDYFLEWLVELDPKKREGECFFL